MKKKVIFKVLAVVLIILILGIMMYLADMNRMKNNKPVIFSNWGYDYAPREINPEDINDLSIDNNMVIIKNGNINNEDLIENFINSANSKSPEEITLIIREYISDDEYVEKELKFIPGTVSNEIEKNETVQVNLDEYKKQQGTFVLISNNESKTYSAYNFILKRKVEDEKVNFYLDTKSMLIEVIEYPIICSYSLESSNYTGKFKMNYHQRKDKGIKTIIDKNENKEYDYSVYTFGGDVSFTIDTDMVYTFDVALEEKVISIEDILEQAKTDEKYGICEAGMYKDGGSIEYLYENYTILKFNTLDGKRDLVIGFKDELKGQFINEVNDILYK